MSKKVGGNTTKLNTGDKKTLAIELNDATFTNLTTGNLPSGVSRSKFTISNNSEFTIELKWDDAAVPNNTTRQGGDIIFPYSYFYSDPDEEYEGLISAIANGVTTINFTEM